MATRRLQAADPGNVTVAGAASAEATEKTTSGAESKRDCPFENFFPGIRLNTHHRNGPLFAGQERKKP